MRFSRLFKGWSFIRLLRLAIGVAVGYSGFLEQDYLLIVLSGFLVFQSVANTGCGTGSFGSCEIKPAQKQTKNGLPGAD